MSVPIEPLGDYVVLEKDKAEAKTKSGFLIPESAQQAPETATVVAVGKDAQQLKVGQRVLFVQPYQADDSKAVTLEKKEYVVIREKFIIATVK